MRPFEILPTVILIDDKGGTGQSLIVAASAELIATKPSAASRGNVRVMSGRKRTSAPSGPQRRGAKKRRG